MQVTSVDPQTVAARLLAADRVHVVGGPGVGKSAFASRIAAARGLELHHLDETAFEGPEFDLRPAEVTSHAAQTFAAEPRWVAEGIFVGWVEPLFDRADAIVWLDQLTWSQAARRIATRWFRHALREPANRRGTDRFFRFGDYARNTRHLVRVLVTSREYWSDKPAPRRYTVTKTQVRAALEPYADKVLRVGTVDEAETVLRLIDQSAPPRAAAEPSSY